MPEPDAPAPRREALIVAADRYEDRKLRSLRAPARDAKELARVLGDPAIGDFKVDVSLNEPDHVVRRKLSEFFRDRGRDDLLLLHVSCHGLKDEDGTLYFASSNTAVEHLEATAIPSEFVNRQMTKSRSKRIVLLLDCCFGGAFARGLVHRAGESVAIKEEFEGQGRVVLTASRAMEYAFEGENREGDAQPSIFTSAVVHGLETGEADRDRDSRVSIDELYDYVYDRVRDTTPNQTPSKWTFDVHGDLFVARSPFTPAPEPVELPAELQAAIESPFAAVRAGAVAELAQLGRGSDPGQVEAARRALEALVADDSRRVSEAAERALAGEPEPVLVPAAAMSVAAAAGATEPAQTPRTPASRIGRLLARGARWQDALAVGGAILVAIGYFQAASWDTTFAFATGFQDYVWYLWSPPESIAVIALAVGIPLARRRGWLGHGPADAALVAVGGIALGATVGFVAYYGFNSSPRLTTLGALAILGAGLSGLVTRRGRETPLTRRTATVAAVGVALTAAPLAVNVGNFNSSLLNEWWGGFAFAVDALVAVLGALAALLVLIGAPRERRRAAGALIAIGLLLALHLTGLLIEFGHDEGFSNIRVGAPLGIVGALLLIVAGARVLRSPRPAPAAVAVPAA